MTLNTDSSVIPAYFFLGPPGSGKGTQSELIQERLSYMHISSGELLREAIEHGEPAALAVQDRINRGELVSDDMIKDMVHDELKHKLETHPDVRGVIFDGFPRTVTQAEMMDEMIDDLPLVFRGMINLKVPEDVLVERLLSRVTRGGKRKDDNEETIRNRLHIWRDKTHPLEDYYRNHNCLFDVDGVGEMEEVFARLQPILKMEQEPS